MKKRHSISETISDMSPWFHNIHLPEGEQTAPSHPLGDFPLFKWQQIALHLPEDLSGKTVLDIGCNAGFYSVECAKRGAKVTAIDVDQHYLKQAEWVMTRFGLNSSVDFHQMQVYDLAGTDWQFDIVLFLGVFYHLRYPLLALDIVTEKVKDLLVFQTFSFESKDEHEEVEDFDFKNREIMQQKGWPSMAFIENKFMNDPTNWGVPNPAAIKAIFRSAGFSLVNQPGHEIYFFKPDSKNLSVINQWNKSEYLSAIGESWLQEAGAKTGGK